MKYISIDTYISWQLKCSQVKHAHLAVLVKKYATFENKTRCLVNEKRLQIAQKEAQYEFNNDINIEQKTYLKCVSIKGTYG